MPRVDRMAFTATTEVSSHDKEVIMAWDGSDDPTGFFDQYSTLNDNVDAQEVDGDDGYSQFGSADPVVIPPPPSSIDSAPPSIDSSVAQPGSYPRSMTGPPSQQARYPHHLAVQSHSPHKTQQGGSTSSDPELLRLDGLSMRSPCVVAPPGASSSTPTSPRPQTEKKSGRLENIYSTIRNKASSTLRSRPKVPRAHSSMATTADPMRAVKGKDLNMGVVSQPPTSLPLAGPATSLSQRDPGNMAFVNGYIDDPFYIPDLSGLPTTDSIFHDLPVTTDGNMAAASTQNWLCGDPFANGTDPLTTDSFQWNNSFAADCSIKQQPGAAELWESMTPRDRQFFDAAGYQMAKDATYNLVMAQLSSGGVDYEYALANGLIPGDAVANSGAGGSIHMPQPRHPPSAALLNNNGFAVDRQGTYPPQAGGGGGGGGDPSRRQQQQQHPPVQSIDQPTALATPSAATFRRPQPRAPSTGARYHHGGSLTSPRKIRDRSTSSSSPSPTQTARSRATSRGGRPSRQQRRSASSHGPRTGSQAASSVSSTSSLSSTTSASSVSTAPKLAPPHAIRKQKSWSHSHNRRPSGAMSMTTTTTTKSRAPSSSSSSAGMDYHPPTTPDQRRVSEGGGTGIGFVNFTPSDHDFLMTGVAPSGSSKTKARREREAADRQRRLNEAVMRAVAAAGGDLTGLRERLALGD